MTDREREAHITSLIRRLNDLDPDRDRSRPHSAEQESDSAEVADAKRNYRETVAAGKRIYDLAFISALEEWIAALESERVMV